MQPTEQNKSLDHNSNLIVLQHVSALAAIFDEPNHTVIMLYTASPFLRNKHKIFFL